MPEPIYSYLVARADRIFKAAIDDALEDEGVTLGEFTALSVIASRPGLSNARLARRSLVTPQAMHRVISSLESSGYVVRRPSDGGGRALGAHLTSEGEAAAASLGTIVGDIEERLISSITDEDRETLVRLLSVLAHVDGYAPGR